MEIRLTDFESITDCVMSGLMELRPYIYYKAATGSIYIKFKDKRLLSLRIGDHRGREKYKYKWNLRKDINEICKYLDRGTMRYVYPWNKVNIMISDIKNYSMGLVR